jgi:hypothetical protein
MRRVVVGAVLAAAMLGALLALAFVPESLHWIPLTVALLLFAGNYVQFAWAVRSQQRAAQRVAAQHPDALVARSTLYKLEGSTRTDRERVIAVVADRAGLSFRDRADAEVVRVAADLILSLELAPHDLRTRFRPALLTRVEGPPVSFWAGATPDVAAETVVALRTALGRPEG